MGVVLTAGTLVPPFAQIQSLTQGVIVSWTYNLVMVGKYIMQLNSATGSEDGWSLNLRGIDFGSYDEPLNKVCVVGANTLGVNNYLNYSFILMFDRETNGSGILTASWNKIIGLNLWNTGSTSPGLNPGWEHVAIGNDNDVYVATRGSRMIINNNQQSDNQFTTAGPMYAAVARLRITDGAVIWIKKFTFGSSGSFQSAKGITKIALRPDALYAQLSVPTINAGYDYLKINPANGFVIGSSGLSSSATMPNSSSLGGYQQVSTASYNLTTTYTSGSSNVVTVTETLDATDLNNTISNQWGINPTSTKFT